MNESKKGQGTRILVYVFLVIWAVIVLFPFYWMVLTSVKNTAAYNNEKIPEFITLAPTPENYDELCERMEEYFAEFEKHGIDNVKVEP